MIIIQEMIQEVAIMVVMIAVVVVVVVLLQLKWMRKFSFFKPMSIQ